MRSRNILLLALIGIFLQLTSLQPLPALDIPLLTWEKGKVQEVVVGGNQEGLRVFLEGNGKSMELKPSIANDKNYKVYRAFISAKASPGSYSIISINQQNIRSVVAYVNIINQEKYEIVRVPIDLAIVLCLLAFMLIFILSFRRIRNLKIIISTKYQMIEDYYQNRAEILTPITLVGLSNLEMLRLKLISLMSDGLTKSIFRQSDSRLNEHPRILKFFTLSSVVIGSLSSSIFILSLESKYLILFVFCVGIVIGYFDIVSGLIIFLLYSIGAFTLLPNAGLSGVLQALIFGLLFIIPGAIPIFLELQHVERTKSQSQIVNTEFIEKFEEFLFPLLFVIFALILGKGLASGFTSLISMDSMVTIFLLTFACTLFRLVYLPKLNIAASHSEGEIELFSRTQLTTSKDLILSFGILALIFYSWSLDLNAATLLSAIWVAPLSTLLLMIRTSRSPNYLNRGYDLLVSLGLVILFQLATVRVVNSSPLLTTERSYLFVALDSIPVWIFALYMLFISRAEKSGAKA